MLTPFSHMRSSKRVLVVQPSLQPPGGGNAVAAWMIQALMKQHRVSVLTWRPIELEAVNAYYGTSIAASDITPSEVPAPLRRAIDVLPTPSALLKASFVLRYAKRIAGDFDLVVCGHNETDLGRRCIQYVHYPARLRPRPPADIRWYHHARPLLTAYYSGCERIAQFRPERVLDAVTLANSTWTARLLQDLYGNGRAVTVVHPPVASDIPDVPWERRENGFVCVGRISPEKELERVVGIVAAVRADVPDAHLHIIGSRGPAWYGRRIRRLARTREWIAIHEDVPRSALFELIAKHRYGIHGMQNEHFGIAPAEAVAGGCVTFVPGNGGQVDIVGPERRLLYDTTQDAVDKIVRVMTSSSEQEALRTYLATRRALFTTERFMSAIRALVDDAVTAGAS
jgi:glycosyltransferase involved in cell wall biosynthesis